MKRLFLMSFIFFCSLASLQAEVTLPPIFSAHAVLQKAAKVPIWGRAAPGEKVTVTLDKATAETTADATGKWRTTLDLSQSSPGPFALIVKGKNQLTVEDVLVGEVWLCSGQSNMEFILRELPADYMEITNSANPSLRQFSVESVDTGVQPDESKGQWTSASPQTAGQFTAVGYYFGKTLQKELGVPVGLIKSARGASACEAWTRRGAFEMDAELKAGAEESIEAMESRPARLQAYLAAVPVWEAKHQRADVADPGLPASNGWQTVTLPGPVAGSGAVWLRRTVTVPGELAGKRLRLDLGNVQGLEQVYWNGVKIGGSSLEQSLISPYRRCFVPEDQVREGDATLLIRLFNSTGNTAILGKSMAAVDSATPFSIDGEWQVQTASSFSDPSPFLAELPPLPGNKPQAIHTATYLFNGQIAPLIPYAIKGVIWYQGEFNSPCAFQYRKTFPLMINDWRVQWRQGDFPFYFCQLANYHPKIATPGESALAEIREAQTLTLALPKTGQAVLIDIGEEGDIHPRNKKDVGARLARMALARDYGKGGEDSGPVYESSVIQSNQIRITFTHTAGKLVARPLPKTYQPRSLSPETVPLVLNRPDSELQGFAICGEDRKWVWADARIDGAGVIVSATGVAKPVAVRYAWANNPTCNLYNEAGLPAGPFRTDDFPLITRNMKFPAHEMPRPQQQSGK
ncbi:MAG: sialate O-acetylesterase [bacterium]